MDINGEFIYIFGGSINDPSIKAYDDSTNAQSLFLTNAIERFNIKTERIHLLEATLSDDGRSSSKVYVTKTNYFIIYGGVGGNAKSIEIFDANLEIMIDDSAFGDSLRYNAYSNGYMDVDNEIIYSFGGIDDESMNITDKAYSLWITPFISSSPTESPTFTPTINEITTDDEGDESGISALGLPQSMFGVIVGLYDDTIHLFGGENSDDLYIEGVYNLNINNNSKWKHLSNVKPDFLPYSHNGFVCKHQCFATYDQFIYVINPYIHDHNENYPFSMMLIYDMNTTQFVSHTQYEYITKGAQKLYGSCTVANYKYVWVLGGHNHRIQTGMIVSLGIGVFLILCF